jgi:hypothetical protein
MEGVRVRRPVVRVDAGVRVSEGEEKEEEDRKQHVVRSGRALVR